MFRLNRLTDCDKLRTEIYGILERVKGGQGLPGHVPDMCESNLKVFFIAKINKPEILANKIINRKVFIVTTHGREKYAQSW